MVLTASQLRSLTTHNTMTLLLSNLTFAFELLLRMLLSLNRPSGKNGAIELITPGTGQN